MASAQAASNPLVRLGGPDPSGSMPVVLSVNEAARLLRVGRNQTYEAIRAGLIGHVRVGRRILIPRVALEKFLNTALDGRP